MKDEYKIAVTLIDTLRFGVPEERICVEFYLPTSAPHIGLFYLVKLAGEDMF